MHSVVQLHGSSETAGVGVRTDPDEPYALLSCWSRAEGDANALARVSPDGRQTLVSLQDVLEWVDDRHFHPVGRIDQGIQVAGVNVSPAAVRRVLMEHPDVLDAAVRRMNADELIRLKAFVVPRSGRLSDESLHVELEAWVASRLSAPERPKAFSFGASIPADESGKHTDWRIVRMDSAEH